MKLTKADFVSYKAQIEQSMKQSMMSVVTDQMIIKALEEKIKKCLPLKKTPEDHTQKKKSSV